ncbi:hypothetical protein T265_10551 [Opisthorchis viverrini]|uniref:Uncharacterized protein n=1 Tax=Opisthorchis viverrini TaxID=6198 RepID=A0A074Z1V4_OPIVI|nr:hypothetical protein T265_10551 [Opisthorchis viverrini]KER21026.1 hypothetical protein T265_10551 [Opisthorchis viverrini]
MCIHAPHNVAPALSTAQPDRATECAAPGRKREIQLGSRLRTDFSPPSRKKTKKKGVLRSNQLVDRTFVCRLASSRQQIRFLHERLRQNARGVFYKSPLNAIRFLSSANRPAVKQRTGATYIPHHQQTEKR